MRRIVSDTNQNDFEICNGILLRYTGNEKEVVIPSNVTSIGEDAFFCCSNLTSLTIPSSVTSIGDGAFYGCSDLTSVTIAEGVTSIGDLAFCDCSRLTSITVPSSVKNIGYGVFDGCIGLADEMGLIIVNASLCGYCGDKTIIVIPEGVTRIPARAFEDNTCLQRVIIPEGVTSIEKRTFYGCSRLSSITIPKSVRSIKADAFHGCDKLKTVYFLGSKEDWKTINIESGNNNLLRRRRLLANKEVMLSIINESRRIETEQLKSMLDNYFSNNWLDEIHGSNWAARIDTSEFYGSLNDVSICVATVVGEYENVFLADIDITWFSLKKKTIECFADEYCEIMLPEELLGSNERNNQRRESARESLRKLTEQDGFDGVKIYKVVIPYHIVTGGVFAFVRESSNEIVVMTLAGSD